ncbi:MAG: class I SAM-dependent methyltransferase [Planctomycetaceae bacterium]
MTSLPTDPAPVDVSPRKRNPLRRLIESKGIGRLSFNQYRNRIQSLYDGPAGAVLALGSVLSLHEPLVGRMIRKGKFDVTRFKSILDLGSGAGQILRHLIKVAPAETSIVACDLSHQMLRRARKRVKSQRPVFVAADMTRMPFADHQFDCVTCGYVIEHLPDPRPGLTEIGRVLRPGGSLLLLATEDTYSGAVVSRTWKCRTYNREELREACEESGLPWNGELWFTPVHRFFRMGGILVEAQKPLE